MTLYERETIINFNELDSKANIYTCNKPMIKKLDALCNRFPKHFKLLRSDEFSKTYEVGKKFVKINAPGKKRNLTEEEREELRTRMKSIRQSKSKINFKD